MSTDMCDNVCFTSPTAKNKSQINDAEHIWNKRSTLNEESRKELESCAFLCVENGELKIDANVINKYEFGSNIREILETLTSTIQPHVNITHWDDKKQVKKYTIQTIGNISALKSDLEGETFFGRDKLLGLPTLDNMHNPNKNANDADVQTSKNTNYARPIDVVRVPVGVCAGDRLAAFDCQQPPQTFIEVPIDSYPDMPLDFERPKTPVKFLLLDGKGYKIGGSFLNQHAVRLTTHRAVCRKSKCSVMGCHGDTTSMLFKQLGKQQKSGAYYKHWISTSRASLRSRGLHFRMMASAVKIL